MSDTRSRLVVKGITKPGGRKISLLTNNANPGIIASKGTQIRGKNKICLLHQYAQQTQLTS